MHSTTTSAQKKSRLSTARKTKFPGMGEAVRSPIKPGGSRSSTKKKNESSVLLSPLKSVLGASTNDSDAGNRHGNIRSGSKTHSNTDLKQGSLERTESFSKYKPLPAITTSKTEKVCSKRTFEKWTNQDCSADRAKSSVFEKDILSDTIKRMKLGGDVNSLDTRSYSSNEETGNQSVMRNHNDPGKTDETSSKVKQPSTSAINLIIRLPDGQRVPHSFLSCDTVGNVIEYLSKVMKKKIDLKAYVLYTNEVPKRELRSRKSTLVALGVQDKSVLALDTRDGGLD